jgi:RsiW-degrading membrane proteinase PrsW (M82 family)
VTAFVEPGSSGMPAPSGPPIAPTSAAPRWGKQASIIQPTQTAFWLFCVLLAVGGYLFVQEQSLMSGLTTAFVLSWVLVLAYAVPVAVVIYRLDLFEREPKLMLAAAVVWGGVVATSLASNANEAWLSLLSKAASPDFATQWGAAIVGPGVEETLKLMGVVILFLIVSSEFDGVMDGFVYGAMIGLGFTVVEDVSYFINAVASTPGAVDQSGPVLDTFLIRVVGGGLYGHVLFTGLTGTGFAFFVTQRAAAMPKRLLGAGLCIVAGVSAHVVWNSPWMDSILATTGGANPSVVQWVEYGTLKGMPFLILLGVLVMFATRSEESNYRAIVAGEPDPMVVTEDEIRSLRSLWARRSARSVAGRLRGPAGARLTGRLQAAQIEYAMVRSGADTLMAPALEAQRLKIRSIRAELAAVPFVPVPPTPAPYSQVLAQVPVAPPVSAQPAGPAVAAPEPVAETPAPSTAAWAALVTEPSGASSGWAPTHAVPAGGIAAWEVPDPARPPIAMLPERVELIVLAQAGAWAQVRGANGWTGWVDGRLLVQRR